MNERHFWHLLCWMLRKGEPSPFTRYSQEFHGSIQQERGNVSLSPVCQKLMFGERAIELLAEDAVMASVDDLKSSSACLMTGRLGPSGTGSFNVRFDPDQLAHARPPASGPVMVRKLNGLDKVLPPK